MNWASTIVAVLIAVLFVLAVRKAFHTIFGGGGCHGGGGSCDMKEMEKKDGKPPCCM